ncbi:MAG: hypothetical protein ACUVQM_01440 [Candidatus Hadarchaeaceae archaeon]
MYYQRQDVRRTILDFVNTSGSIGVRECAVYNTKTRSLQRYLGPDQRTPIYLGSPSDIDRMVATGATAFYASYWRYYLDDFNKPFCNDLVWTTRSETGLKFSKVITSGMLRALEELGATEPWVKYSGGLGFDIIIPFELVPIEVRMGGVGVLQDLQGSLTNYVVSYLIEHKLVASVEGVISPIMLKRGKETCLLSELRVKRGLLLAPMSLNPETGLVSVPIDPRQLEDFSVLQASPEDARGVSWTLPKESHGILRQTRSWLPEPRTTEISAF